KTNLPKLIYPYGIKEVNTAEDIQLRIDEKLESIGTHYNNQDVNLAQYTLTYDYPSFNIEELKKDGEDPAEIKERYTQLPDDLPNRVSTLSEEITSPFETRYEQVSAIEKYFGQSGEYKYQIADVPVPEANQDYVDQFLFNSQVGYCDNYSTSMIVMLRTLDIPARWVKGFTSGEQVTTETAKNLIPEDSNVYEVTNTNAHSWVEVYFPDVGWVPFEPTQGFSNPTEFYTEVNSFEDDDTLEAEELEDSKDENEEESLEEDTEDPDSEADEDEEATEQEVGFTLKRWHLGVGAGVLALILVILFMKRYHIQAILLTKKLERERDVASFQTAYHFLLKLLEKKGSGKDPQQTLREYAKNIDSLYSSQSMRLLTKEYEQILYNNKQVTFKNNELPQLWKDLVEKVLS
ncbi:MAG TPA: DUF4129 domain-containing transglutaminase family protein, partial [Atopostipes sp.]|nr:DUF4129 domain-containing transglutaminase family protein [Atopostipes sp.]